MPIKMQKLSMFIFLHVVIGGHNFKNDSDLIIHSTNGSFFKETNLKLDTITKELFNSLKLDHNYTKSTKIKVLTFIHQSLRNVSEVNFKEYNDLINISKVTPNDKPKTALFNLTMMIGELFNKLHFNAYAVIDIFDKEFNNIEALFKSLKFIKHYNTSEGIVEMIKFFIERKDSNILQPINPKNETDEHKIDTTNQKRSFRRVNRPFRKPVYKLRAWHPSNESSELTSIINNRRIYKGKKVPIHRYSFIVSIHIMGEFMCSGSIISRDLIITSASCLQIAYKNPHLLKTQDVITIRAGTELTRKGGVVAPVIEIHFHPKYDPVYLEHNLALARIKMSLTFRSSEIKKMRRIEFDTKRTKLSAQEQITILGWGDKDSYTRYVGPLTMGHLDVYDFKICKEIYTENYVHDTNFCTGFVNIGGGACKKDSGGPGLVDKILVGIVNFGPPVCGTPDAPTVFTKLGFYAEWIDSVITKVLRPPHKNSQPITFRQVTHKIDSKEKILENMFTEELATLKRLFTKYVKSGIINITDLMGEERNDPVVKLTAYIQELSKNSLLSKSTPPIMMVTVPHNKISNIIQNQTEIIESDGESKSNSLTGNAGPSKSSGYNDDETEGGISIDSKPYGEKITKVRKRKHKKSPKSSKVSIRKVTTTTTRSKPKKFTQTVGINTAKNLYPWGTENLPTSKEEILLKSLPQTTSTPASKKVTKVKEKKSKTNRTKLRIDFDSYNDESESTESEKETDYTIKYLF